MRILLANGRFGHTFVSNTGGVLGREGSISTLGMFPMPSNSAKAGVSVASSTTIERLRIMDSSRSLDIITTGATTTLLENTEKGSNIVLSLIFENVSGNFGNGGRMNNGSLTTTLALNGRSTCGTMVGPARNAVLAIMHGTTTTTRTLTSSSYNTILSRTCHTTRRTLTRAPRLLPILGRTNIMSTNNRKFLCVLSNVENCVGRNGFVRDGSSTSPTGDGTRRDGSIITTTSKSVGCNCYDRFLVAGSGGPRDAPLGLGTCLRSVNSYIIIISSSSVMGIRIRSGRPNGMVRTTLGVNRLVGVGVSGVHCRRTGTSINVSTGGSGGRRGLDHSARVGEMRPAGSCNFITITTNSNVTRLFGRLNYSMIISNNRAVGPDASSVLGTIRSAPTGRIFILPGGGGVVVTTRRAMGLTSENIDIITAGAIPRNVATVLGFSSDLSDRRGRLGVTGTTRDIRATRIAFTTHSDIFNKRGVGRNRCLNVRSNGVALIRSSLMGTTCEIAHHLIGGFNNSLVAMFCNRRTSRGSTGILSTQLRRHFPGIRMGIVGNNRPICCFVSSIRWRSIFGGGSQVYSW